MKERIRMVMETENMSPARFADSLQIGRAVISHILNGRNNPSLDIITKILAFFPHIDSDWLLTGSGSMYRYTKIGSSTEPAQIDLFTQAESKPYPNLEEAEYSNQYSPQKNVETQIPPRIEVQEKIVYVDKPEKKILQIIIYYSDNSFEIFNSGQKTP